VKSISLSGSGLRYSAAGAGIPLPDMERKLLLNARAEMKEEVPERSRRGTEDGREQTFRVQSARKLPVRRSQ
jgi:hypothetical protein